MRLQPWTEAQLMRREAAFELTVERAINQTLEVLSGRLRGPLTASVELPGAPPETAPQVSFTALEGAVMATWTAAVDNQIYPFLVDTFTDSAQTVVKGVKNAFGVAVEPLTNVYAQQFLAYAHNRMVGIGQVLWEKIRDELSEGFAAGDGIKEIAQRLETVAGLATPRALTTARTEVISAANAGSYLQMIESGFDDSEVTKVWLATEDPRTRLSHRHADNQGVALTGEFSVEIYAGEVKVGEEQLEFPGDPSGTPGNIINCRCSLAFDFNEDAVITAAAGTPFIEAQHPRDKDGKFKKKGAADKFVPGTLPDDDTSVANFKKHVAQGTLNKLNDTAASHAIAGLTKKHWDALDDDEKSKVKKRIGNLKGEMWDAAKANIASLEGGSKKRALGGVDTKTGKALVPGKPTKLRVQLLYNTTFEDGAIMAVRKDSGERIVWDGQNEKIKRQKLVDGKYKTTDTLSRGAAYKAWKDEDGWTIPDAASAQTAEPSAQAGMPSAGKPVAIKVQLIYQTPFNDGDTVAVNPGTGERITWDATKKRMIVHAADGSTKEYTRGALYKAYKDSTGWHLPGETGAAPAPAPDVTPAVPDADVVKLDSDGLPKFTPEQVNSIFLDKLHDSGIEPGDLLWENDKYTFHKAGFFEDGDLFVVNKDTQLSRKIKNIDVDAGTVRSAVLDTAKPSPLHKPSVQNPAPPAAPPPAPVKAPYVAPKSIGGENNDVINKGMDDPDVPVGTVLFESTAFNVTTKIVKTGEGTAEVQHTPYTGASGSAPIESGPLDTPKILQAITKAKQNAMAAQLSADKAKVTSGTDVTTPGDVAFNNWKAGPAGEIIDLFEDDEIDVIKNGVGKVLMVQKGGGLGQAKMSADDVTPENLDKAIKAVKAGLSFYEGDPIPEVGEDQNGAPGSPQSVLAGNPNTFSDAEAEGLADEVANSNNMFGDVLFENDDVQIIKWDDDNASIIVKATQQSFMLDKDELYAGSDLLNDKIDALLPAGTASPLTTPSPMAQLADKLIQAKPTYVLGDVVHEDGNVSILKTPGGTIDIENKQTGKSKTFHVDQVSEKLLTDALQELATPDATKKDVPDADFQKIKKISVPESQALQNVYNENGISIIKTTDGKYGVIVEGSTGHANITSEEGFTQEALQDAIDTLKAGKVSNGQAYTPKTLVTPSAPVLATPEAVGALQAKLALGSMPDVSKLKATGQSLGTHGGKVFKDDQGNNWLFKPAPTSFKAAAEVDLATSKLHEMVGLPTPDMGIVEINGQTGSLQKMIPGATNTWGTSLNPSSLTPGEVIAIQKEHIFDWLVANHDAHAGNLLKDKSGNLVGIDKGQAFKWLGQDKLETSFKPNEHPQAANVLYQSMAKGGVVAYNPEKTPQLKELIDKIQAIPDDQYKALLRPYAEQAAKEGKLGQQGPAHLGLKASPFPANNVEAFLNAAVARKNSLASDYQAFFNKQLASYNANALGAPINPPTVHAPSQIPGQLPKQVPFKMSAVNLTGAKSTGYKDGQVIAENPTEGERLLWNGKTKKYVIQAQDANGKWQNIFTYNKQAALANLKGDEGWVTPSVNQAFDPGNTPGTAAVPSISGQNADMLQPENIPAKSSTSAASKPKVFGPNPKFTVDELKAQADKRNANLTEQQKNGLYTLFRTKGAGGASTVKLASEPKDQWEGLLQAYLSYNKGKPANQKVSFLQILRAVDEVAAGKAGAANNNAFENKIVNWLQTEAGKVAAQKVAADVVDSLGSDKAAQLFNKTIKKFQDTAANRAKGTTGYKKLAKTALANQSQIQAHVPGTDYKFQTLDTGKAIGQEMKAKYGAIPDASFNGMKKYTGNSYTEMNTYLRSFGHSYPGQGSAILAAEEGMKPSTRPITVYRNSNTVFDSTWKPSLEQLKDFVGVTFREDAFASTSTDGQIFNGYPYRFVIEVPEGTPLAWVDDFSSNKGEKEFLLGSGLHYEILEIIEPHAWKGPGASTANKTAVIKMRIVPPPPSAAAQLGV